MNKVLSITWKLSEDHAPHIHNAAIRQDSKTSLFQGSKPEDQHTRKTLGTPSWVYKPSNNPIVFGVGVAVGKTLPWIKPSPGFFFKI